MHINKKDLIEFDNGNMNTQEVIEFLSHLDHCDFCLDQMMEQEDNSTDTAPSYLMEQILDKADSGEVQLARAANQASRKIRLLHYSLQTAAGDGCPAAFIQYPEPGFHLLTSGYFLSDRQNIART